MTPGQVALQEDLKQQQPWAAVPTPVQDLFITTVWNRASATEAVVMPGRGWQPGDRAEQPDQSCGWEGTAHRDFTLHPSLGPGEKPLQGLVHRDGDVKSWESH